MGSDVVWLDDNLSLVLSLQSDTTGGKLRSTESLGDFDGGVDADDVRSLDDPLYVCPIWV